MKNIFILFVASAVSIFLFNGQAFAITLGADITVYDSMPNNTFGTDARIRAGCINKGQHRHIEAFGHFHQAQGLAVTFRSRHTKISLQLFLGITALLLPDVQSDAR